MSKNSLGRFPSVRTTLQRRQSKQATGFSQLRQQPFTESDKRIFEQHSSTSNQVTKKIQNKLRMRKQSGSQKGLKDSQKDMMATETDSCNDPLAELREKIDNLWENSQQVYDTIAQSKVNIVSNTMKQELIKQASLIMCQVAKGEQLEDVVVQKIRRKIGMLKCIKKCQEKQNSVKNMFDDRLQKLSIILRTR